MSKIHAKIGFSNKQFWIYDFDSTYGTLQLLSDKFEIKKKE